MLWLTPFQGRTSAWGGSASEERNCSPSPGSASPPQASGSDLDEDRVSESAVGISDVSFLYDMLWPFLFYCELNLIVGFHVWTLFQAKVGAGWCWRFYLQKLAISGVSGGQYSSMGHLRKGMPVTVCYTCESCEQKLCESVAIVPSKKWDNYSWILWIYLTGVVWCCGKSMVQRNPKSKTSAFEWSYTCGSRRSDLFRLTTSTVVWLVVSTLQKKCGWSLGYPQKRTCIWCVASKQSNSRRPTNLFGMI